MTGIDREDIIKRIDDTLASFYMSPSAMKKLDSCQAYYILEKVLLPKIEPEDTKQYSILGRTFHSIAEENFDKDTEAEELADDTDKVKSKVKMMKANVQARDYYKYPAENEKEMRYHLRDLGDVYGILDRVAKISTDGRERVFIIDYKTTSNVYPDNELRQMLTYAYLMWKVEGYQPEDITVILDYVAEPEPFTYVFSEYDLQLHENYMVNRFKLARKLLTEFKEKMDVKRLVYCPGGGACSFCPLDGMCLPYKMWTDPGLDILDPERTTTTELIKEKIRLDEISKLYVERIKVLNRTLLLRYNSDGKEPDDQEGRTMKEIVASFFHKIESQSEEYLTRDVMAAALEKSTRKVVKKEGLIDNIDLQELNTLLLDMILPHLPARIDSSKVPETLVKSLKNSRFIKSKAPYLRHKK